MRDTMRALAALAMAALALTLLLTMWTTSIPALAQNTTRLFSTRPALSFSFDRDPTTTYANGGALQSQNSSFEYSLGAGAHTGLLSFDGTHDYVDLRAFYDDNNNYLTDALLGGDVSFEVWVSWTQLRQNGRVFDFGGPAAYADNNIFLSTQGTQSNMFFGIKRNAVNSNYLYANNDITLHEWAHIVCTVRQTNFVNEADPNAAVHTIYLNGVQVANRTSYLPIVMRRPFSWLARSNWEFNGDARFRGLFDDFLVYNYSLGAEAVNAHYVVPRVAVFEMVFDVDPRVNLATTATATYGWTSVDSADTPFNQAAHNGLLSLSSGASQYVDAAQVTGSSALGTAMPVLGGDGWSAADVDTKGWSFEVAVKFTSLSASARVFDIGNLASSTGSVATDRISLGLSSSSASQLVFEASDSQNGAAGASLTVLSSVEVNRWYHIVVVVQPIAASSGGAITTARYYAYVDGVLTNSLASGVWLRGVSRQVAYIGRSTRGTDPYLNALIDSIRIYDYVTEQSEVSALYSSVARVPTLTAAMQSVYVTSPKTAHTFDVSPPWSERNDGTSIGWSSVVAGRAGCLTLNGVNQWVNLYSLPDRNSVRFPSYFGGASLSFEFWVLFNEFESGSRVFEFTNGDASGSTDLRDRLVVANSGASNSLIFVMSSNTTETMRVTVPNAFRANVWQHIVVSFRAQQPYNLTALSDVRIYVNKDVVVSGVTPLPPYVSRANNWLGRSRYAADGYLNGTFDSFYYYNYALEQEQVSAHYVLPLPPMFELVFASNPRVFGVNATVVSWSWVSYDSADSAADRANHPGLLMLSAAQTQYVDLASGTNSASVGTVLPTIGELPSLSTIANWSTFVDAPSQRVGMSIEVSFKYNTQTSGANAKVFACGSSSGNDAVWIGFSSTTGTNALVLSVLNSETGRTKVQTLVSSVVSNQWYHVLVVMRVATQSGSGTNFDSVWTVLVNGVQTATVSDGVFPASNARGACNLGRDPWAAASSSGSTASTAYMTGAIDVFRVYDYALTVQEASNVYQATTASGASLLSSSAASPVTVRSSSVAQVVVVPSSSVASPPIVSPSSSTGAPVTNAGSSDSSLSGGSIAGIVIGVVIGVILIAVVIVVALRRSDKNAKSTFGGVGGSREAGPHIELSEIHDDHEAEPAHESDTAPAVAEEAVEVQHEEEEEQA